MCEPWRPSKITIVFFQSLTSGVTFPLEMAFSCRLLFSERLFPSSEPWKTQQCSLLNFSELMILALNIGCTPPSETHPLDPHLGWPHILVGPEQVSFTPVIMNTVSFHSQKWPSVRNILNYILPISCPDDTIPSASEISNTASVTSELHFSSHPPWTCFFSILMNGTTVPKYAQATHGWSTKGVGIAG